jgi:hypothetical protein
VFDKLFGYNHRQIESFFKIKTSAYSIFYFKICIYSIFIETNSLPLYNSLKQNIMENRKLFQKVEILCECCGKNLLEKDSMGIFVTWLANQKSSNGKDVYQKAYYCCKGKCDDILKKKSLSEGLNYDRWEDISSFTNPIGFIKKNQQWMKSLQEGEQISDEAYGKLSTLFWASFLEISRDLTLEEEEKARRYMQEGLVDFL